MPADNPALRETIPDTDALRKLKRDHRKEIKDWREANRLAWESRAELARENAALLDRIAALERDKEHALRDELAELIRLVGWMPTIWHEGNTYLKSYDVHKMLLGRFEALAGPAAQEEHEPDAGRGPWEQNQ